MADMALETLIVRLTGEANQYLGMLKQAEGQTKGAVESIKKQLDSLGKAVSVIPGVGQALALLGATIGSFEWLKSAREKFEQAELGIKKFTAVIELSGRDASTALKSYREFAVALADVTTTSKGTAMQMLREAETMGLSDDMAKAAVKNAVALAAAKGGEAEGYLHATIALAKGNTHLLGHLLGLQRNIDESTRLAEIQKLLGSGWVQAREEGSTNTAEMQRMSRVFDELKKDIGRLVDTALMSLLPTVQLLSDQLKEFIASVDWDAWAKSVARAFTYVTVAAERYSSTIKFALSVTGIGLIINAAKGLNQLTGALPTLGDMGEEVERRVAALFGDRKKAESAALKVGSGIGQALQKGVKESAGKLEAAGFFSAEAITRVQAMMNPVAAQVKPDANTPILKKIDETLRRIEADNKNPSKPDTSYSGEGGDF